MTWSTKIKNSLKLDWKKEFQGKTIITRRNFLEKLDLKVEILLNKYQQQDFLALFNNSRPSST